MTKMVAPQLATELTVADHLGAFRMRLGIGRNDYRVEPGLYRVGDPSPASPVLVTGNYKYTVDVVRSSLPGVDAWLLVLDTKGINVWCAAGKQTFGTKELCQRVMLTRLDEVVEHRTLVLPQLGASGVAAHRVTAFTEFEVVYGPVRAADIPAFLSSGMQATPEMRRVSFGLWDRFLITGVEVAALLDWRVLAGAAAAFAVSGVTRAGFTADALLARGGSLLATGVAGVLSAALMMLLLPWLPFRSFAAKGALVGAVVGTLIAWLVAPLVGWIAGASLVLACATVSSYGGMNYTGSSAITSPSGVEYEMRRAIPWQVVGAALALVLWVVSAVVSSGKVG